MSFRPTRDVSTAGPCGSSPSVVLTWTASASPGADGYEVLRSSSLEGPFLPLGAAGGRQTETYTDTTVAFSTTYFYAVGATSSTWRSTPSPPVSHATESALCL
jgi:hypothetical protein